MPKPYPSAFRHREDGFRDLFARFLREVEERDTRSARLLLDPAGEVELRGLLARESRCCSFFDFEVEVVERSVRLTVRVPDGCEPALAFLLSLRPVARPSA